MHVRPGGLRLGAGDRDRTVADPAAEEWQPRTGGAHDAGRPLEPLEQRFVHGGQPRAAVPVLRRVDAHDEQVAGVDAEILTLQRDEGAHEERGAEHQHERQRDLRDHEAAVPAVTRPCRVRESDRRFQIAGDFKPRCARRRDDAEHEAREDRDGRGERHDYG